MNDIVNYSLLKYATEHLEHIKGELEKGVKPEVILLGVNMALDFIHEQMTEGDK